MDDECDHERPSLSFVGVKKLDRPTRNNQDKDKGKSLVDRVVVLDAEVADCSKGWSRAGWDWERRRRRG